MSSRRPSIPRPPPSPLRPGSPPANPSALSVQTPSTGALLSARRATPMSPPKTRARDLLRKHYGLGVGLPPARPGVPNDPMNMDSPVFDAKAYYEQLITTSTLPALLKQENELVSEIRELDSERQSLVYNHHHELIAASDTIAAMKSRAESLDADLDLLKAAFSEISRLAEEVAVQSQFAGSKDD
ncbi:Vps51/Vps67-domain-containing protein [Armillaria luteobubalina]|uniref:Vacuolar protein sorting-associated protein 51 homolog n=1 Tax=Armillaria luteobubalina TaxID=153913 RepID=A0AA39QDR0_9AGAR|nr:Vps51/Vps67-domain-containing protein [Armillaria luteobubalina]